MIYKKPLSIGKVATICRVSKRTVLNWVYRKALPAFTTYGGHYRIWPNDLRKFLMKAGLNVPFNCVDDRQPTILIIDDDLAYSTLLKEAICSEFPNVDILMTDDGYEGLILIGERKPSIVLLDLKMPKVDGFEVLKILKSRIKDYSIHVIVLSGYIDNEVRMKLKNTIAEKVLEKGDGIQNIIFTLKAIIEPQKLFSN